MKENKSLPKGICELKSRKVGCKEVIGYRVRVTESGKTMEKRFWFSEYGAVGALKAASKLVEDLRGVAASKGKIQGLSAIEVTSGGRRVMRWSANFRDPRLKTKRRKIFPYDEAGRKAAVEFLTNLAA